MSFNIMSLFSGAPAATPPAAAPATQPVTGAANPGQPLPGTQASGQTAPNGVVPAQGTDPNAGGNPGNSDASPLAAFTDIWQTPTNTDPNANQSIFANLDPAKVRESAAKVNFTGGVNPDQLKAIAAGGEGAVKAFQDVLNAVAQGVYAQSTLANVKIVEQALGKAQETYDARIPGMVKKLSSSESLVAENPLLANPAVQPLVGALQQQLIQKNPNATSAEIQRQISDYFSALGQSFAPKAATPANQRGGRKEDDWSLFL
jgi:hypothetical protein